MEDSREQEDTETDQSHAETTQQTDPPDVQSLNEELKRCQTDLADYLSGWQRAKADYVNYKNEEAKRLEDTARFVTGSLIQDMLPVLDSFDLALKTYHPHADNHSTPSTSTSAMSSVPNGSGQGGPGQMRQDEEHGMLLIRSQLLDVLKKRGLEQIRVSPGDRFNPERHEALVEVESDLAQGSVVEEIQKGYMLRERIIRPARVSVAREKR